MPASLTSYKTTYQLTEIDARNIEYLAAQTAVSQSVAVHQAIYFCQLALQYRAQGQCTGVLYKSGGYRHTAHSIGHNEVAQAYNNRPKNAQPVKLVINRHTDALQAIHDIKTAINTPKDEVAVAYALEFAATTVKRIRSCNHGKNARILFSYRNSPSESGSMLRSHPYDLTLGNKFRRSARRMKSAMGKINPFKKKPAPVQEPAPQPAPAAVPSPAAASADQVKQAVDLEIQKIQNGTLEPVKTMRAVTFRKKRRGFIF